MGKYFHLSDHMACAYFKDESILLDLKADKFYVLDKVKTGLLRLLLEEEWCATSQTLYSLVKEETPGQHDLSLINRFIATFREHDFLEPLLHPKPYALVHKNKTAMGMPNIDWRLPLDASLKARLSGPVLKALRMLLKVHMTLKFQGFYALIQTIRKQGQLTQPYRIPTLQDLNDLVQTLNQACLFYPVRTKCLEWAATLTLMALHQKWPVSLHIGVQNYPFLSHAWCQWNQEVIADSPLLPERMAVILSTPLYQGVKQ